MVNTRDANLRSSCGAEDLIIPPSVSKTLHSASGSFICDESLRQSNSGEIAPSDGRLHLKPEIPSISGESGGSEASMLVKRRKAGHKISLAELKEHNASPSLWITVNNKVYDVTKWAKYHPGGEAAIKSVGGRDATDIMTQFHRPEVWQTRIENWYVGDLDLESTAKISEEAAESPSQAVGREFRELNQWLLKNGWYIPSNTYILSKMAVLMFLISTALYLFFDGLNVAENESPKWTFYLSGILLGLFWQQSNFVGHDVGHSSVFQDGLQHSALGLLVGNTFTGLSINWWKHSHYTHHVTTNVVPNDPDIQHLPVIAVSDKVFRQVIGHGAGIFSKYWNAYMPFDKAARFLVSYQHYLYYPIMSVARVNLLAQSILFVLTHPRCNGKLKIAELCSLAIFYTWYGYLLYLCPSWGSMLGFWYLANATVGIIHVQICLSHFMMETFDDVPYEKDSEESFFEFQLRTTLDVDCPRYMDWFHGGLQYQVIHHLYPRVPRNRLRDLRKKVEEIVDRYPSITYHHYTFTEANLLTLDHMKKVAMTARAGKLVPFENTMIFEGLNAIG